MSDLHKIILSPVDGGEHTDDAARITADCGHEAWIAPTSLAAVANPLVATQTVCMRCIKPEELRACIGEHGGLFALPGAREELNRVLGVGQVDQLWAQFRVRERVPEEE